jgi:hypothetical protein
MEARKARKRRNTRRIRRSTSTVRKSTTAAADHLFPHLLPLNNLGLNLVRARRESIRGAGLEVGTTRRDGSVIPDRNLTTAAAIPGRGLVTTPVVTPGRGLVTVITNEKTSVTLLSNKKTTSFWVQI